MSRKAYLYAGWLLSRWVLPKIPNDSPLWMSVLHAGVITCESSLYTVITVPVVILEYNAADKGAIKT